LVLEEEYGHKYFEECENVNWAGVVFLLLGKKAETLLNAVL